MKEDKKIEHLEAQLARAKAEAKETRAQAKKELEAELKKRESAESGTSGVDATANEDIKRYKYSGFVIMTIMLLYIFAGLSPRQIVKNDRDAQIHGAMPVR